MSECLVFSCTSCGARLQVFYCKYCGVNTTHSTEWCEIDDHEWGMEKERLKMQHPELSLAECIKGADEYLAKLRAQRPSAPSKIAKEMKGKRTARR